nr:hypothetical protein [Paenibacillus xylanexedens]
MKKFIQTSLVAIILLNIFSIATYAENPVNEHVISGKVIQHEDVKKFISNYQFSGEEAPVTLKNNNAIISGENVSIKGQIEYNNAMKPLDLTGSLYNSETQKDNLDAYVGELKDTTGNFDVEYFFLKNNDVEYKETLNKDLAKDKLIILYLKDKEGNLLLFESNLDQFHIDINNLSSIQNKAEPINDFLWFTKIVDGIVTEDQIFSPQSNHSTYTSTNVYSKTTVAGGKTYKENVRGEVKAQIVDVGAGVSTAYTTLTLKESTYIDGTLYSNTSNFTIHNGKTSANDLKGHIALGYNTTVNYSKWTGTYSKQVGVADVSFDLGIGLAGKLASASIPISFSQKSSREENDQSTSYYAQNGQYPKTAGMAIAKTKGVYLDKNNDYFTLNTTISTIDTGLTKNYQSLAKFLWNFDIYYYGQISPVASLKDFGPQLYYLSNYKG